MVDTKVKCGIFQKCRNHTVIFLYLYSLSSFPEWQKGSIGRPLTVPKLELECLPCPAQRINERTKHNICEISLKLIPFDGSYKTLRKPYLAAVV